MNWSKRQYSFPSTNKFSEEKIKLNRVISVILALCTLVSSCSGYHSPYYEKLAEEITENTAKKIYDNKKLYMIGSGGQMMNNIQVMDVAFQCYQEIDLQSARELIVYAVTEFLTEINHNEEVRPFLNEYPFIAKNVEVEIYFSKPDKNDVSQGKMSVVEERRGKVVYYIDSKANTLETIYEETYEEAMKKVSSQ